MKKTKRGDFLRILLCPPAIMAVAILSSWGKQSFSHEVRRFFSSKSGPFVLFIPLLSFLVVGLLLVIMLDVSDEVHGSKPLLCVIIFQLALPLVFLLTKRLQMLFIVTETSRTTALTTVALIFLMAKILRKRREA